MFHLLKLGHCKSRYGITCKMMVTQFVLIAILGQPWDVALAQPTGSSRQLLWPEEALRDGKIVAPMLPRAKQLFEDNFDNPDSGFPRGASAFGENDYQNGRYFIRTPGGPSMVRWIVPHAAIPNCALQVTGRAVGLGTDSWGVRVSNYPFHWLTVSINNNGELLVEPDEDMEPGRGPKVGPIKHSAIKTNETFNTLLLVIRGRVMEIYVNDVAVCDPVVSDRDLSPTIFALRSQRKEAATNDKPEIRCEFEKIAAWPADGLKKPESRGAVYKNVSAASTDPVPGEIVNGPPLFVGDLGDEKLVQDRFTVSDGPKANFGIEDRLYQILAKAPGRYRADISKLNKVSNFACLAYGRLEKPAEGGWGLTFADTSAGRFEVQLRENGGMRQIRMLFVSKETDEDVIPWQNCPPLRTMTQFNALRVEANGKTIRLFANGVFVSEKDDSRVGPGGIHPLVDAEAPGVDARFSFLHVWRLKPAPAAKP